MKDQPDEQRIAELAEKWLNGTINETEAAEFARWYHDVSHEEMYVDQSFAESRLELSERIFDVVSKATRPKIVPFYQRKLLKSAAAAAILIIGLSVVYYSVVKKQTTVTTTAALSNDIHAPSQTNAILTLADGSQVILDNSPNGGIAVQNGAEIIKKDGELIYERKGLSSQTIAVNTVSLPKGSLPIQLKLSDGSRVWLNAASSISYPALFVGTRREVTITGEVYFEVTNNASAPFIVKSGGQHIEVLGTAFNINSYADEPASVTTIIDGSVRVNAGQQKVILQKGQQAIQLASGLEKKAVTDAYKYVAWKDNRFVFGEQMDIEAIMRILERWYNIKVQYHGKPQLHFGGSLPRNIPLAQLLNTLEKTGGAHFSIEGNVVTVRP